MSQVPRVRTTLVTALVLLAAALSAFGAASTPGAPATPALAMPATQSGLTPRVVVPMLVRADAAPPAPLAATVPARPIVTAPAAPQPAPVVAAAAASVPAPTTEGMEASLIAGMNAERATGGLAPLTVDATLTSIARTRSQQMAGEGYFGHVDPRGRRPYIDLLAANGVTYQLAGENLALNNYPAIEAATRALVSLMASPSHRENILEVRFTRVGVGVVTTPDGKHYLTTIFAG